MLFKFGFFWKSLIIVIAGWILYSIFGYEFTAITLLSLLVAFQFKEL
jgi:hypothetical protein